MAKPLVDGLPTKINQSGALLQELANPILQFAMGLLLVICSRFVRGAVVRVETCRRLRGHGRWWCFAVEAPPSGYYRDTNSVICPITVSS